MNSGLCVKSVDSFLFLFDFEDVVHITVYRLLEVEFLGNTNVKLHIESLWEVSNGLAWHLKVLYLSLRSHLR